MIGVNLKHVFFAAQAVVPQMQARGGGSIINMSSIAWMRGAPALPAYAAAKAAIVGFTNSLARLVGPDRIRVNAIAPGMVITERQRRLWYPGRAEDRRASLASGHSRCGDARRYREPGAVSGVRREPAHHAPVFSGRRRHRIGGRLSCAMRCMANTVGSQARRPRVRPTPGNFGFNSSEPWPPTPL